MKAKGRPGVEETEGEMGFGTTKGGDCFQVHEVNGREGEQGQN